MCIIILNKTGILPKEHFENSIWRNKDGAGLMYAVDGKLHTFKSLKPKEVVEEYYRLREKYNDVPIGIHFRLETDGGINTENCHPYEVNSETMLMHNGILGRYSNMQTNMSDTRLFIADILSRIPTATIFTNHMLKLIAQAIGVGNKFLLINKHGSYAIVNEGSGHWDDNKENWYSNDSYKPWEPLGYVKGTYSKKGKRGRKAKAATPKYGREVDFYPRYNDFCEYCEKQIYSIFEIERRCCNDCYEIMLTD